jgi:hypothetical protein
VSLKKVKLDKEAVAFRAEVTLFRLLATIFTELARGKGGVVNLLIIGLDLTQSSIIQIDEQMYNPCPIKWKISYRKHK